MTHPWPFKSIPGAHEGGTGDGPAWIESGWLDTEAGKFKGPPRFCSTTAYERAQADIDRLRGLLERARDAVNLLDTISVGEGFTGPEAFAKTLLADIDKELGR